MSTVDQAPATRDIALGTIAGLRLSAGPSAVAGAIGMWALLGGSSALLLDIPPREAVLGGLAATGLHFASEIVHQLGHAAAARRTGNPMVGIRLWGVLSSSVYPADEPALPAAVHIRRALGGPTMSLLVTLAAVPAGVALYRRGGTAGLVAAFGVVDNLAVFTLGSLLPLGFTDGSTLLHWWRRR